MPTKFVLTWSALFIYLLWINGCISYELIEYGGRPGLSPRAEDLETQKDSPQCTEEQELFSQVNQSRINWKIREELELHEKIIKVQEEVNKKFAHVLALLAQEERGPIADLVKRTQEWDASFHFLFRVIDYMIAGACVISAAALLRVFDLL